MDSSVHLERCPWCSAPTSIRRASHSGGDLHVRCTSHIQCGAQGPRVSVWDLSIPDHAPDEAAALIHLEATAKAWNDVVRTIHDNRRKASA